MIWIASGSRSLTCKQLVFETLDDMLKRYGKPRFICTGSSYGIDTSVKQWIEQHNINHIICGYDENYGRSSVEVRNDLMVRTAQKLDKELLLVLMWDGESFGSRNLKYIAQKLNIKIEERILSNEYYN